MKREILFRGKRLDSGGWEYGYPHNGFIGTMIIDPDGIVPDGCEYGYGLDKYCLVDPATVGQFTGLCDKNGVKIFEGDIVKTHYANAVKSDFVETVVFHNGRFCANSNISETGQWWTSLADGVPHVSFDKSVYMESCKVIGNIHDTPDLGLKEESE